ncbi:MAG: hypothetical protein ABJB74_04620 [Gemmatimonas sp.]
MKRSPLMLLRQGDISDAICPTCKAWREIRFEYRTTRLTKSKIDVADVLVGVCQTCDDVASIPQQSAPKLREARQSAPSRIDARIPKELRDVIGMMASEFGGSPEPFAGGMLRYYLAMIARDSVLAKRIGKLANSASAAGTPGGRIAFRLERSLIDGAMAKVNAKSDVVDQSGLIRGIIVAAREDSIERPMDKRVVALRAIALAMG